MNSLKFKLTFYTLFGLIWSLLVFFFLSPWYEETLKKDIFELKQYKFSNFLILYDKIEYNKFDYVDGAETYFRDAFGFETKTLEGIMTSIKVLSTLAFLSTTFLIYFTIIFYVHIKFIFDTENHRRLGKKVWCYVLIGSPLVSFFLSFITLFLIIGIPTAVRNDCYKEYGKKFCNSQLRYHTSFIGENQVWLWGPSRGWIILMVDTILTFFATIYCWRNAHKFDEVKMKKKKKNYNLNNNKNKNNV
ncbi:hypothetical protein ACTFIZ_012158 [Dictyostelium cf. discoideum]